VNVTIRDAHRVPGSPAYPDRPTRNEAISSSGEPAAPSTMAGPSTLGGPPPQNAPTAAPQRTAPSPSPRFLHAPYLSGQESLLVETRGTPLFYLPGPIAFLVVVLILVGLWAAYSSAVPTVSVAGRALTTYVLYLFLLLLAIGLIWLVVRYLRWISTVYAVTDRRVVLQRGIAGRNFDEIPILQVRGVDVHQSFGQRILGYGTVRVSSEGSRTIGNEDWEGVPHPFRFQKIIENATIREESRPRPVVVVNPSSPR
jgi:membrane protein YdbS with pleckstrin-like domain